MIKRFFLTLILFCSCSQNYDYSHIKVTHVIDGDTVKLADGKTLRYIGIDTPETRIKQGGNFMYQPQPFAIEAKKLNEKLVLGKTVKIEFDVEKTDKYKRLLGYCFLEDGTFVNNELLKQGLAVIYTHPPNIKFSDTFFTAQQKARKEKKGLWGAYETINAEESYLYVNQIRTVRGTVKGSRRTKKCTLLNLAVTNGKIFKVVIFENSYKYFSERDINLSRFYTGKTIEVSGKIRRYNGSYEIIANTPQDIIVLNAN
ncbi:MAG: thermonuclease family protein [Candidatus Omnitrophica bacterium]|nr:thermonuclease family protein [Candidatus Omnitrophota bacterium]